LFRIWQFAAFLGETKKNLFFFWLLQKCSHDLYALWRARRLSAPRLAWWWPDVGHLPVILCMSLSSALCHYFDLLHTPMFLNASWQGRRIYIEIRRRQGRLWRSYCFRHLLRCPSVASLQAAKMKMKFTNYALADEAPKSQGIPTKLTLNLLAPHQAIFTKKEVDQVIFNVFFW